MLLAAPCDRVNRNLTAAIFYAIAGGSTLIAPWCSNLIALCFLLALNGGSSALMQIGKTISLSIYEAVKNKYSYLYSAIYKFPDENSGALLNAIHDIACY